jgi:hypothetical protein
MPLFSATRSTSLWLCPISPTIRQRLPLQTHNSLCARQWARSIALYKAPNVLLPRPHTKTPDVRPSPSEAYLSASLNPSPAAQSSRKLLVLDLNGCLVHRSSIGRVCYPRPHILPFRQYLFHPSTRSWLDVMVWSAAQPHNVAAMVDACFGDDQNHLVGVWARDRMQLRKEDYSEFLLVHRSSFVGLTDQTFTQTGRPRSTKTWNPFGHNSLVLSLIHRTQRFSSMTLWIKRLINPTTTSS